MNNKYFFISAITLLLVSCKPSPRTLYPDNSAEQDTLTTNSTTTTDSEFVDTIPSLLVEFDSDSTRDQFLALFAQAETTGLELEVTEIDNTTVFSFEQIPVDETMLLLDDEFEIMESDLNASSGIWDKTATALIMSTMQLTPYEVSLLQVSSDSLYEINQIDGVTYEIVDTSNTFDATSFTNYLTSLAKSSPVVIESVFGKIEGMESYLSGASATLTGVATVGPTEISIRTSEPFEPSLEKVNAILPGSVEGYKVSRHPTYRHPDSDWTYRFTENSGQLSTPHLKEMVIQEEVDGDPIIALTNNTFDGAILYKKSDIDVITPRLTSMQMKLFPIESLSLYLSVNKKLRGQADDIVGALAIRSWISTLPFNISGAESLPNRGAFTLPTVTVLVDQERPIELAVANQLAANIKRVDPTCEVILKTVSSTVVGQNIISGEYDIYVGSIPTPFFDENRNFGKSDGAVLFEIAQVEQYLAIKNEYFLADQTLKSVAKK